MESLRPRRITEFIEILWRKKRLLVLMSLAMLIATAFVIRRIPNRYESSSTIVIGKQASEDQRVQQAPRFSAHVEQINSRDNISILIRKYNLYPEIKHHDDAIKVFQKDLTDLRTATKIRDFFPQVPESLKISYRHRDPVKAHQIVTEITNTFTAANSGLKQQATADTQRYDARLSEVEAQLRQLGPQKDINQLRLEMLARRPSDAAVIGQQTARTSAEQTIEKLNDEKDKLEVQIQQTKSDIVDQEKIVNQAASTPTALSSAAMGTLLGRKADIQARIDASIAKGFTERHPNLIQLRNEMTQNDVQIARLESNPQQSGSAKLQLPEYRELLKMQRLLTSLQAQLDQTNRKLTNKLDAFQRMPVPNPVQPQERIGEPTVNQTAKTQYEQLLTQYQWLLNKRDESEKLANAAPDSAVMYQVTEQPNLPQLPFAPNKLILQLIALGIALVFGLLVAFGTELPRFFQINDERDIEYYLGAPVLATIPETLTPIERSHKRKIKLTRGVLVLMLVGVLIPAFIILLNTLQIFQILGRK